MQEITDVVAKFDQMMPIPFYSRVLHFNILFSFKKIMNMKESCLEMGLS